MSTTELVALLGGREVGRVYRDAKGHLRFVYNERWRRGRYSYPLSLSMPLTAAEHPHSKIDPFLWGLLPDNDYVLQRWAQQFHVGRNAFSLLAHVGEECAGAVQFAHPEHVSARRRGTLEDVAWLREQEIGERLRTLREDSAAWRHLGDSGQFSLAGAQRKTALLHLGRRWGIPSGRIPTTHILKPPIKELDSHVENEHFCLELARSLGLPAAQTLVRKFGDEIAIVIKRYDRIYDGNELIRVHQEDMCQALGVMPTQKYQSDGGPSPKSIVDLIRDVSSHPVEDVWTFVIALGFNWLVGGTDAHGKNYSLLIGDSRRVRLAPLYDLASILVYPAFPAKKVKLAMKIGSKYLLEQIDRRQWIKTAHELGLDEHEFIVRLRDVATNLPDAAASVRRRAKTDGLESATIDHLAETIVARARGCRAALD